MQQHPPNKKSVNPYLKVIVGPMMAGKSTLLLDIIAKAKLINEKICVIGWLNDFRSDQKVRTHSKLEENCNVCVNRLYDIYENQTHRALLFDSDLVVIDEGHFFEDLDTFLTKEILFGQLKVKYVVVAGLMSDYNMVPFRNMMNILIHANKIIHTRSLCMMCRDGTLSTYNYYLKGVEEGFNDHSDTKDTKSQVIVGGVESYVPVCRYHYIHPIKLEKENA